MRRGYPLPTVINPPKTCITIELPDDPNHIAAFWGQIAELGHAWAWQKDNLRLGREAARVWLDVFHIGSSCMALYDLRQSGILIERQDSAGGTWSTLYDPRNYVILKAPDPDHPNVITPTGNTYGLYVQNATGNDALIVANTGLGGRGAYIRNTEPANPDPLVLLNRTGAAGDYIRAIINTQQYSIVNRYGQITSIPYYGALPSANQYTVGSIIYLAQSNNPSMYPTGAYIGVELGGAYYWAQFRGQDGTNGTNGLPAIMQMGSLLVDTPNNPPQFTITPTGTNNTYAVGVALPRARDLIFTNAVTGSPGSSAAVSSVENTNGDKVITLTIPRGDTGTSGLPAIMQMGSLLVDTPNNPPQFTITPTGTNNTYLVGVALPRARDLIFTNAVTGSPGSSAAVSAIDNTNGDKVVTLTIPRGYDGASAQYAFDVIPPSLGAIKHYSMIVPASGTLIPFPLLAGDILNNVSPRGLWNIEDPVLSNMTPCGADGFEYTTGNLAGNLEVGFLGSGDNYFNYEAYTTQRTAISDSYVALRQHVPGNLKGWGYIWVDFDVQRPTPIFHIVGTHDFEPSVARWHAVGQAEAPNVNFGGQWLVGTGGHGGFHPTYNNTASMYSLSIAPPLTGAPLTRVNSVQIYWEDAPGSFYWTVEYRRAGTWYFSAVPFLSGASGNNTITVNQDCDRIILHFNSYGVGTADWRIRKAIITGTE